MIYCDYIAHLCREALSKDPDWLLSHVGKIDWDLDYDTGSLKSTTKVILLEDNNGKKYKVTVEEA